MNVFLLATLDTKGREIAYVRDRLRDANIATTLLDTGCVGDPWSDVTADITREQVFEAAGTSLAEMRRKGDRGVAMDRAAQGAVEIVREAHAQGRLSGVLAIGGSAGTAIGTSAMRVLPLGVPKVMVSTLASGDVRAYVRDKDIVMINSVVDILGLNRISRTVLAEAAGAMAGMVKFRVDTSSAQDKPLVAATMFGVTTPCVERARDVLEQSGYEVLVFHATGTGGQAMESLIRDGLIVGVLDITTTELADELVGGFLSAGPDRLSAAAHCGIPQVVSVGATDMVNFYAMNSVPEPFKDRTLYQHNPQVTLMRTTAEENARIGEAIGRKVAASTGPAAIVLPRKGVSAIDREGQPFDDPQARQALYDNIRANCGDVELMELDHHINDAPFADAAAWKLIELMNQE